MQQGKNYSLFYGLEQRDVHSAIYGVGVRGAYFGSACSLPPRRGKRLWLQEVDLQVLLKDNWKDKNDLSWHRV